MIRNSVLKTVIDVVLAHCVYVCYSDFNAVKFTLQNFSNMTVCCRHFILCLVSLLMFLCPEVWY